MQSKKDDQIVERKTSVYDKSLSIIAAFSVSLLPPAPFVQLPLAIMESKKDKTDEKRALVVGPWGGHGGINWDDGPQSGVREIKLKYDRCIDSVCIVYDKNGKPFSGPKHGGVGGTKTVEIKVQFPEEFLTTVTGHYCPVVHGGSPVIRSITFKSNRRTFGPYGVEEGTPFYFPMEGGQIVGFKGKCGWYLDSIGFYIARTKAPKVMQKVQQRFRRLTSSVSLAPPPPRDVKSS
ncbi:Jacalin-related lectin 19 [Striga hermonthica]|uniref:Jacalin-related lectin 19 n=1 Tax=Striga hermonthica TaxID=68872 RepID=A0A9N7N4I1_STRHE|nr:Jacalin-related lectin 19 [Striga hermonthica]